jgi:hypothetical protein
MSTRISTQAVISGQVPDVCARHGEPAAQRRRVEFNSKTPGWVYLLLIPAVTVIGVIPFAIVVWALRKGAKSPNWPFCAECAATRRRRLWTGLGLVAGSAVVLVAGLAVKDLSPTAGAVGGVGFVLVLIAALFVVSFANWRDLGGAVVTRDGLWVEVAKSDACFAEKAAALPAMPSTPSPPAADTHV